jgi:hypothetical protein
LTDEIKADLHGALKDFQGMWKDKAADAAANAAAPDDPTGGDRDRHRLKSNP